MPQIWVKLNHWNCLMFTDNKVRRKSPQTTYNLIMAKVFTHIETFYTEKSY